MRSAHRLHLALGPVGRRNGGRRAGIALTTLSLLLLVASDALHVFNLVDKSSAVSGMLLGYFGWLTAISAVGTHAALMGRIERLWIAAVAMLIFWGTFVLTSVLLTGFPIFEAWLTPVHIAAIALVAGALVSGRGS